MLRAVHRAALASASALVLIALAIVAAGSVPGVARAQAGLPDAPVLLASAMPGAERLTRTAIPGPAAEKLVEGAVPGSPERLVEGVLPPPPDKAVLVTKGFGTVTVDHRKHLKLRVHCASCHGPGPVTKLHPMKIKVAHDRCVGCHREAERGPQKCRDCHVVGAPAAPEGQLAKAGAGSEAKAPGASGAGNASTTPAAGSGATASALASAGPVPVGAAGGGAAGTATGLPPASLAASHLVGGVDLDARRVSRRTFELGYGVLSVQGLGAAHGPALRVRMEDDGALFTQTVQTTVGGRAASGRTLGTLGFGWALPLHRRASASLCAVGGFDAVPLPSLRILPALGVEAGAELRSGWPFPHVLHVAVTGMSDVTRPVDDRGRAIGRVMYGVSAGVGIPLGDPR